MIIIHAGFTQNNFRYKKCTACNHLFIYDAGTDLMLGALAEDSINVVHVKCPACGEVLKASFFDKEADSER